MSLYSLFSLNYSHISFNIDFGNPETNTVLEKFGLKLTKIVSESIKVSSNCVMSLYTPPRIIHINKKGMSCWYIQKLAWVVFRLKDISEVISHNVDFQFTHIFLKWKTLWRKKYFRPSSWIRTAEWCSCDPERMSEGKYLWYMLIPFVDYNFDFIYYSNNKNDIDLTWNI